MTRFARFFIRPDKPRHVRLADRQRLAVRHEAPVVRPMAVPAAPIVRPIAAPLGIRVRVRQCFFFPDSPPVVYPWLVARREVAEARARSLKREMERGHRERSAARAAKRAIDPFRVGEKDTGWSVDPGADWRCPQWQAYVEAGWNPKERRARFGQAPKPFRKRILSHVRTAYAIRARSRMP